MLFIPSLSFVSAGSNREVCIEKSDKQIGVNFMQGSKDSSQGLINQ